MLRRRLLSPIRNGSLVLASLVGLLMMSAPAAAQTGTVSGTVTNANTGAPIAGVWVGVATVGGSVQFIASTDAIRGV